MNPSPFEIGSRVTGNAYNAIRQYKDTNAIEDILSQAMNGDPQELQNNIGKILSQVSPEKQGMALQVLQQTYGNIQQRQQKAKEERLGREAAQQAGYTYGAPDNVAAQQVKNTGKSNRLSQYGLSPGGGQAPLSGSTPQTSAPSTQYESPFDKLSDAQLRVLSGAEDKEISEPAKATLNSRQEEIKSADKKKENIRSETLPLKKEISDRAQAARASIQNKENQIDIIKRGKIDDPTYVAALDSLPFNYGKRFLSPDTVEYRSGLVDEFKDLRQIFQGATRVKEIDIMEGKIADVYLTDEQKLAILNSRINAAKVDIIREEAALELEEEGKDYTLLQYRNEVEKRAKPKIDALFNRVLDEHQAIMRDAENMKKIPLNYDDPEGRVILAQIMKEAGGDRNKARQLAKKKGYTIGK